MFSDMYAGKSVLVTGHTGFKGSWLTMWLEKLGAIVTGFSSDVPSEPNHVTLLNQTVKTIWGDIRDRELLTQTIQDIQPEIIFHLAAQPLVRLSYEQPIETFETNVTGTMNLLEAVRTCSTVKALVIVTSDKCYDNSEDSIPFIESDPMGGFDPYSASKGMVELLVSSYRNSFFDPALYGKKHSMLIASVRAGNVIGGGDWGKDRLVPDIMKTAAESQIVEIRSPNAVRPWQHVLEPLSGYLLVGQRLLEGDTSSASGWNFGPASEDHYTVQQVCETLAGQWNKVRFSVAENADLHEAQLLRLDCSKAARILGWKPVWNGAEALSETAKWYREFYESQNVITSEQLEKFLVEAKTRESVWSF